MFEEETIGNLVLNLRATLNEIDWSGRKHYPQLRSKVTPKKISNFEEKLGCKFPLDYKEFLAHANGMEGASGNEWLVRGVSEVRSGTKFRVVEREYFPKPDYKPKMIFVRDETSPTVDDSFLIGTDFVSDVAIFRKGENGFVDSDVYVYRAPDLIEPFLHFSSFTKFLDFIVSMYESKLDSMMLGEQDSYEDELDALSLDLLGEEGYQVEDRDDDETYDLEDSGNNLPIRKKGSRKGKSSELSMDELNDILSFVQSATERSRNSVRTKHATTEPQLPPEMQRANRLIDYIVSKLLKNKYLEITDEPSSKADLEDFLLRKLLSSTSPKDAVRGWFEVLLTAREVEDLYGTDDEIKELLLKAFDEFEK